MKSVSLKLKFKIIIKNILKNLLVRFVSFEVDSLIFKTEDIRLHAQSGSYMKTWSSVSGASQLQHHFTGLTTFHLFYMLDHMSDHMLNHVRLHVKSHVRPHVRPHVSIMSSFRPPPPTTLGVFQQTTGGFQGEDRRVSSRVCFNQTGSF